MIEKNKNHSTILNFESHFNDNTLLFNKLTTIILDNLSILKKLEIGEIYNTLTEESNKILSAKISNFLSLAVIW